MRRPTASRYYVAIRWPGGVNRDGAARNVIRDAVGKWQLSEKRNPGAPGYRLSAMTMQPGMGFLFSILNVQEVNFSIENPACFSNCLM
jgi:hypothetical protein